MPLTTRPVEAAQQEVRQEMRARPAISRANRSPPYIRSSAARPPLDAVPLQHLVNRAGRAAVPVDDDYPLIVVAQLLDAPLDLRGEAGGACSKAGTSASQPCRSRMSSTRGPAPTGQQCNRHARSRRLRRRPRRPRGDGPAATPCSSRRPISTFAARIACMIPVKRVGDGRRHAACNGHRDEVRVERLTPRQAERNVARAVAC